jgi:hypothetical protein
MEMIKIQSFIPSAKANRKGMIQTHQRVVKAPRLIQPLQESQNLQNRG